MGDNIRKSGFDILRDNVPAGATGWDMLKDPANAAYLARALPKAKPVPYPPPKPFEIPSWSGKVILTPWVWKLMEKGALETALEKIDNLKLGLEYMNPINYEGLANEAANRHISKQKR